MCASEAKIFDQITSWKSRRFRSDKAQLKYIVDKMINFYHKHDQLWGLQDAVVLLRLIDKYSYRQKALNLLIENWCIVGDYADINALITLFPRDGQAAFFIESVCAVFKYVRHVKKWINYFDHASPEEKEGYHIILRQKEFIKARAHLEPCGVYFLKPQLAADLAHEIAERVQITPEELYRITGMSYNERAKLETTQAVTPHLSSKLMPAHLFKLLKLFDRNESRLHALKAVEPRVLLKYSNGRDKRKILDLFSDASSGQQKRANDSLEGIMLTNDMNARAKKRCVECFRV